MKKQDCTCNCQFCRAGQHCGGYFCQGNEYCVHSTNGNVAELLKYDEENYENIDDWEQGKTRKRTS